MNKEQVIKLLMLLQTAYPRFYVNQTKDELAGAVDLWHDMFKNENANLVFAATKELLGSLKFPPAIADIKEKMYDLTNNEVDNVDLWNELDKAVRNCLYNTQQVFEGLSPLVKKFVGSPAQLRELAMSDTDTFCTVTKGQFLKQVEILKKREKEKNMMLPESRALLEKLTDDFKLLE